MTKLVNSSDQLPRTYNHQFYINKYRSLCATARRINEEIEKLKVDQQEINRKLDPLHRLESLIHWKSETMRWHEKCIAEEKPPKNPVPRKAGVVYLTNEIDVTKPIRPDQKRCHKRLINKERIDMEYLQEVEEELLSSKKIGGMTSCGTQELNDLIKSMAQRIQHGSKNRKEEKKIHDKLQDLKITREVYTALEPIPCNKYSEKEQKHEEERRDQLKQSHLRELKNILSDLEINKAEQMMYKRKFARVEAKLNYVERKIKSLEKELEEVNSERRITYNLIRMLRQLQETCYDKYQSLSLNVKNVAGDFAKVKKLCDTQVEWFKAWWNEHQLEWWNDNGLNREDNY